MGYIWKENNVKKNFSCINVQGWAIVVVKKMVAESWYLNQIGNGLTRSRRQSYLKEKEEDALSLPNPYYVQPMICEEVSGSRGDD